METEYLSRSATRKNIHAIIPIINFAPTMERKKMERSVEKMIFLLLHRDHEDFLSTSSSIQKSIQISENLRKFRKFSKVLKKLELCTLKFSAGPLILSVVIQVIYRQNPQNRHMIKTRKTEM